MKKAKLLIIVFMLVLFSTPCYANVVWPALMLEARIFSWWAISFALLIEYIYLRKVLKFSIKESSKVDLIMNISSAIAGAFLIPVSGIVIEIFPGFLIHKIFNFGTFNIITWILTVIIAAIINAIIETKVIEKMTKSKISIIGMFFVNFITVSLAYISILIFWPSF